MTRLSRWLAWASAAAMLLVWFLMAVIGDLVWWTLPLVYGPHWATGALLVGVLPALFLAPRDGFRALAIAVFIFVFGVLDFQLPFGRLQSSKDYTLRLMEMNTGAGSSAEAILQEVDRLNPDIIVVAECNGAFADQIKVRAGWAIEFTEGRQCFATRLPMVGWEIRDPTEFYIANGSGNIARAMVQTPAGVVRVGLVHLETPREALEEFFDLSSIPTLGDIVRANIEQREKESKAASEWIFSGGDMPTIVAGDFNIPTESAIYRRHWSRLNNAFSSSGFGLGNTKRTSLWGIRIDHILTTNEFTVSQAAIGNSVQADHWPIYADLTLDAVRDDDS